jgi:hypothetical protein
MELKRLEASNNTPIGIDAITPKKRITPESLNSCPRNFSENSKRKNAIPTVNNTLKSISLASERRAVFIDSTFLLAAIGRKRIAIAENTIVKGFLNLCARRKFAESATLENIATSTPSKLPMTAVVLIAPKCLEKPNSAN